MGGSGTWEWSPSSAAVDSIKTRLVDSSSWDRMCEVAGDCRRIPSHLGGGGFFLCFLLDANDGEFPDDEEKDSLLLLLWWWRWWLTVGEVGFGGGDDDGGGCNKRRSNLRRILVCDLVGRNFSVLHRMVMVGQQLSKLEGLYK